MASAFVDPEATSCGEHAMKQVALVFGGAILGGLVGHFAFGWLLSHGFYGLVLPGGLLGMGAGIARSRLLWPAIVCGVMALALGLFTEWRFFPFKADDSFGYFMSHAHRLSSVTLLMLAAGTAIGFWVPFRRVEQDRGPKAPA
jgi:hypothetical protein